MTTAITEASASLDLSGRERIEIRVGGFGGQGIILAGYVLGRAATVHAGRNAVMAQSYGPESRGGACMTEVVIADGEIAYPRVVDPALVVVMSQQAYAKYALDRSDGCVLIVDEDLVAPEEEPEPTRPLLKAPATRLAEELGQRIAANIVMLGFVSGATQVVPYGVLREAVAASVPRGSEETNLTALERGYQHALELVGGAA
jgi:2-oxoglutarate ferredoxin oxidoreductase subunit gamma